MSAPELKPCPFCGAVASVPTNFQYQGAYAVCDSCHIHAPLESWNRRAPRFTEEERGALEFASTACMGWVPEWDKQKAAAATIRRMLEEK